MVTMISKTPCAELCATLEVVEEKLESKQEEIVSQLFEKLHKECVRAEEDLLFYHSSALGRGVHSALSAWAENAFTDPLEKELAKAWLRGSFQFLTAPAGQIQKEIRSILSPSSTSISASSSTS